MKRLIKVAMVVGIGYILITPAKAVTWQEEQQETQRMIEAENAREQAQAIANQQQRQQQQIAFELRQDRFEREEQIQREESDRMLERLKNND